MADLIYPDESYLIMGACFEVYANQGPGFLEAVYQESLEIEFRQRGIPFSAQVELTTKYKGHPLKQTYKADFVCYEKILIELKALSDLTGAHNAQVLNYLKATGFRLGLLINFGRHPRLEHQRIVL